MEVNFNGARINLARAYDGLFEQAESVDRERMTVVRDRIDEIRSMIGAFLSMYCNELGFKDLSCIDLKDPHEYP